MTKWFPERQALTRVGYKHSKPPTYGPDNVKLREGVLEVLAIQAEDYRPEVNYPIENSYVLMAKPEDEFVVTTSAMFSKSVTLLLCLVKQRVCATVV